MLADDKIKVRMITQVDGVNCTNTLWFNVQQVPATDSLTTSLLKLATSWWDSIKANISSDVVLACADWDNQTRNEAAIVYPQLAGGTSGDHHPALSIVSIHVEGWTPADATPRTVSKTRNSVSGFLESASTRGRLASAIDVGPWEAWMTNVHLLDTGELSVMPLCRHDSAGKAWRDAGSVPPQPAPVYEFHQSRTAKVSDTVTTFRRRKTRLCA